MEITIDGIVYTNPNKTHCTGFRVYDIYEYYYDYLGWCETITDALQIYQDRIKDTDGECCVIILQCVPTDHQQLWGIIERTVL